MAKFSNLWAKSLCNKNNNDNNNAKYYVKISIQRLQFWSYGHDYIMYAYEF